MKSQKNRPQQTKSNQVLNIKVEDNINPKDISETKAYVFGKEAPPLSIKNLKEIFKEFKIGRQRMRLICMFNLAGKPELFTIDSTKSYFKYLTGYYIIPQDDDPQETNSGLQFTFYNQAISSPISLRIPVEKLKSSVEDDDIMVGTYKYNIEYALNPELVKKFMMSQIIEKTMQGQDMQKIFDKIIKMSIIGLVVSGVILLILINYTGLLNNIPFL